MIFIYVLNILMQLVILILFSYRATSFIFVAEAFKVNVLHAMDKV